MDYFIDNYGIVYWIMGILVVASVVYTIYLLNTEDKYSFNSKLNKNQIRQIEYYIRSIDPREFEILVANLFRYNGYKVDLTPQTNDHGKDCIVYGYKDKEITYVECKHYKESILVNREILQKLLGACSLNNVRSAIIITTSNYTKTAIECKKKCPWLELWYIEDLIDIIKEMNEVDLMNYVGIVIDDRKIIKTS